MSVLTFIITAFAIVNDYSSEQIAFNHFASEVLDKNYSDSKGVYFSGQTEGERSIVGPFAKCFETDSDFSQFYYQQKRNESEKLTIECDNFHRFKKTSKTKAKKLNLKIYRAVTKGEMVYVYIKVFKEKHFVDHYLIKIASEKVVDVCHMNEII